jgi:hypothetical protein
MLAAFLAVWQGGCSRQPDSASAGEALSGTYCLNDVQIDPLTYHFAGPRWLLQAAEGQGPRTLTVTVAGLAAPLVSTNTTVHPSGEDIQSTVGYSMTDFYFIQATALHTVDTGSFKRVEAYTNYQRTAWVIRDAACNTILGQGFSFKPIGVYFQVVNAFDLPVSGVSLVGGGPGCGGDGCDAPVPDDKSSPSDDAGDGDGGVAGDGGPAGDGGAPEGGK